MASLKTTNKSVAVKPIVKSQETKAPVKGLDMSDSSLVKLLKTTVVFKSGDLNPGDEVYVRSDSLRFPAFIQKFELDNEVFLLVPEELIVLVGEKQ